MSSLIRILLLLAFSTLAHAQAPIVLGAAVPQSGSLAPLAADYRRGLLLWQDEINASGGLLGRRVELRILDDASDAARTAALYAQLIRENEAHLLIGPFGTAATLMAGAEAERARRVLINGSSPSRAVHRRAPRYLFQTTIPNSAYGTGVLELVGSAPLFILARDDPTSREMAEATREAALERGLQVGDIEIYGASTSDFTGQIGKARAAGAGAWIAFGEVRDAADMLRTFKERDYAPELFFARSAGDPRLIALVGQDAEFSLAAREYDSTFKTAGNAKFVAAFAAKWSLPPGPGAAQGYAAASVLAEAVRRTGALDQEMLRQTLAQLEMGTVLGGYKVDAQNGEQRAARPAVVQILQGRGEVVWPEPLQTANREPYPPWGERRILK